MNELKGGIDLKKHDRIHKWINYHYGKASKCEGEDCSGESEWFEWALIHGKEYAKDVTHFRQLCRSCHMKYDMTQDRKNKISNYRTGTKLNEQGKYEKGK